MEQKILTCIGCPLGCLITTELEQGEVISVTGNSCKRGEDYARKEVTSPTRILTTTVKVSGGDALTVSVKTKSDIPKSKLLDCVKILKEVAVQAPIAIGDIVIRNIADTGVDIVATRNIQALS